jgi:hypothetical protein
MEFKIKFFVDRRHGQLIEDDLASPSLDMVDDIREHIGNNISIEQMHVTCPYFGHEVHIYVSENSARQIPYFKGTEKIKVEVPSGYLGRYLIFDVEWENDSLWHWVIKLGKLITGKYPKSTKFNIKTILDSNQIITDWVKDGTPLEWGFPSKEK